MQRNSSAPLSPRSTASNVASGVSVWSVKKLKQYLQSHNVSTEQFTERNELVKACLQMASETQPALVDMLRNTPAAKISALLSSELLSKVPHLSSLQDLPAVQTKVCGKVFKEGDLAYNCLTCQSDGTCVQCQQCFNASDHDGHVGITFHRTGSGGTCDCGDFESWKESGCCPTHQQQVDVDPSSSLSPELFQSGTHVFAICVEFLLLVCNVEVKSFHAALANSTDDDTQQDAGEIHILLHNDDYHTYEEVTESLVPVLGNRAPQGAMAQHQRHLPEVVQIDKLGRAEIIKVKEGGYPAARAQLMGSKIRQHKLIVSFARENQLDLERNAVAVVAWIQSVCKQSPALARVFVQQLINPDTVLAPSTLQLFTEWLVESGFAAAEAAPAPVAGASSLLDVICQVSTILPKVFVLQLRELFLHLIYDDLFKCEISSSVGINLPNLAVACARGLGVEEDSLLQMSFHFFTSKQIARTFAAKHQGTPLLSPIISAVEQFLTEANHAELMHRSIMNRKNRLFFQAFRYQCNLGLMKELPMKKVLEMVYDFQHKILAQLHFLDPHLRRQEVTHVEFESDTWHIAFDLTMETFLNLVHPMVCAVLECDLEVVQRAVAQVFDGMQNMCVNLTGFTTGEEIYTAKAPVSFHLPLHRFACDLLLGALRKFPSELEFQLTRSLAFVDHPLRLYIATCQMANNQWVRDGQTVFIEQSYYRAGARFCFLDLDIKLLAVAARVDPTFLLQAVERSFGAEMTEEYFKLCASIFHSLPVQNEEAMLEVALIHALAASTNAAMPLTDIVQSLQSRRAMMDSFEDEEEDIPSDMVVSLLNKIAVMSLDKNMERKFSLKPEVLMHQVDANSWFLSQNEREQVNELREQKLKSFPDLVALPLCPSAPLACLPWFTPVRDTLSSNAFLVAKLAGVLEDAVKGNEQLWKCGVRTLQGDGLMFRWSEQEYEEKRGRVSPNLLKITLYLLTLALRHLEAGDSGGVDFLATSATNSLSLLESVSALRSPDVRDLENLGMEWILQQFASAGSEEVKEFLGANKPTSAVAAATQAATGKTKKSSSKKRKATEAQHSILERMRLAQQKTSALFKEEEEAASAANGNDAEADNEGHMCSLCRSSGDVKELGYFAYYHESAWYESRKPQDRTLLSNRGGEPPAGWEPLPKPFQSSPAPPLLVSQSQQPAASAAATTTSMDWGMVNSADLTALRMSQEGDDDDEEDDVIDADEMEEMSEDEDQLVQLIFGAMEHPAGVVIGDTQFQIVDSSSSGGDEEEEGGGNNQANSPPLSLPQSTVTAHGRLPPRLHVRSCGHAVHVSCLTQYQNASARNPMFLHMVVAQEYACSMCKATSNCVLLLPQQSKNSPSTSNELFSGTAVGTADASVTKSSKDIAKRMLRKVCFDINDEYEFFSSAVKTVAFTWQVECNSKLRPSSSFSSSATSGDDEIMEQLCRDASRYSSEHLALFETLARASGKVGIEDWRQFFETGKTQARICSSEGELVSIAEFDPFSVFIILTMLHWDELSRANLISMAQISMSLFQLQQAARTARELFALQCKLAFAFKVFRPSEEVPLQEFIPRSCCWKDLAPLPANTTTAGGDGLSLLMPLSLASHFVELPTKYEDLYSQVMQQYLCPSKKQLSKEVALCLLCGQCVCAGASCCMRKRNGYPMGAATQHAMSTAAGLGVFLMLQRCQILLVHGRKAMFMPAPYLDANGYPDPNLSRGKPLVLNEERYASLQRLVADHLVPNEVMRNRGDMQRQFQFPIDFHF